MKRLRRGSRDWLVVAGLALLPLLLYGPVTVGGRTMVPADNLFQWAPWRAAAETLGVGAPQNGLLSDLILENVAWKRFVNESVAAREIPLWNPYLFAGTPFLATGQHSALYPFSLLFLILPLAKAYGWYTLIQLWLAGTLMYALARVWGQGRGGAALAGLVYQGCGFMVVSAAVFPMIIGAAAWLPLLLLTVEMVLRRVTDEAGAGRTLPWMVLGAGALGVQVLAGHIEMTLYSLLVMGFYAAWRLGFGWRLLRRWQVVRTGVWLAGLVALGLMLGAIQLIPFYEVGQVNFRQGAATLADVRGWGFPERRALTLLLPDFFGNPADHAYRDAFNGRLTPFTRNVAGDVNPHGAFTSNWGIKNYVEGGIYLGILPLLLAATAVVVAFRPGQPPADPRSRSRRRAYTGFNFVLSLLSLSFIFGTPLYALIYYLPFMNQLHSPFRWVFPLSLAVAALAGWGLEDVLTAARRGARWPGRLGGLALLAGGGGLLALLASRLAYPTLEPALTRLFLGLALAADAFPSTAAFYSHLFWQVLHLALVVLGTGALLLLARRLAAGGRRRGWTAVAWLLVLADLALVGYGFNAAVDPALLDYRPAVVDWLDGQRSPGNPWRLTSFESQGGKPFNANAGWLYGFHDVRGYDSIIPGQYTRYMAAIEPQNELPFNRVQPIHDWAALNSPLLDLLGARYILADQPVALPKLAPVWEGEGLFVYENLAAMPRAYTLPATSTAVVDDALAAMSELDPRQYVLVETADWPGGPLPDAPRPAVFTPALVTAYGNNEVVVETAVDAPAWLILNDSHFPGWRVFLAEAGRNGGEVEEALVRVNGNFRGVPLTPGQWTVRFRYSPLSFRLGGLTSLMAGIILAFGLVVWGWRRYYRPQGELSNTLSIAKNSLAPMVLNLFNRGIDFIFAAFYLRLLGPADAGAYATAIAIAGWFEIISNFGLNTLVIREVSQDRGAATRYLVNTSVLRLGTSLLAALPIALYFAATARSGNPLDAATAAAILLLAVGMLFSGVGQGVAGLFYAYEIAERPAAIATVTTILKVGFGVVVLLLGFGFVGLAAVSIVVNVITLAILLWLAWRAFPLRDGDWRLDVGLQRRMIVASYPLMLNHLLAVVFFQIDVPLLRQFNGDTVVGWYNSAYKWVNAFNVIPSFLTFALFPVISRQVQSAVTDARRTYRMSLKLLTLVSLPLAAMTTLLARLLIGVLGGAEFLPDGAIALQIVIWSIPFGWLNSVTNYVLIALGQERRLTGAFIAGVAFNFFANLLFLPRYGYVAAAVTTILSEIILLWLFNRYLRGRMAPVQWVELLWRPVAATAVMGAAILAGALVHTALGFALGLLAYPAALWALRVIGAEERAILRAVLPAPLAGRLRLVDEAA